MPRTFRYDRQRYALAGAIRRQTLQGRQERLLALASHVAVLLDALTHLCRLRRKLLLSRDRPFTQSRPRLAGDLLGCLGQLPAKVDYARQAERDVPGPVPSLREVYEDLGAIEEEFPAVEFDASNQRLIVETEPIVLQGLYLGPFAIDLRIDQLGRDDPGAAFAVQARDPQPAGSDPGVTHPHVSGERLCCGEAIPALRQCFRAGRLLDGLLMIRSVLNTYNPDSAYVQIDQWEGRPCYDCATNLPEESLIFCEHCRQEYCEDCVSVCNVCCEAYCLSCCGRCEDCDQSICPSCRVVCDDCGEGRCPDCHENHDCETAVQQGEDHEPAPATTVP